MLRQSKKLSLYYSRLYSFEEVFNSVRHDLAVMNNSIKALSNYSLIDKYTALHLGTDPLISFQYRRPGNVGTSKKAQ